MPFVAKLKDHKTSKRDMNSIKLALLFGALAGLLWYERVWYRSQPQFVLMYSFAGCFAVQGLTTPASYAVESEHNLLRGPDVGKECNENVRESSG